MDHPLVSVIIPTYNREATIGEAIQSALDQTYPHLEIVVVDDGSTDCTWRVLESFGQRIRVFRQQNAGPSAARNRAVAAAEGEIVAFLDSDDVWFPRKIERQVRLLLAAGPAVPCCLCNVLFTHLPDGKPTSFSLSDLDPELEEGVWHNPTEVLISRFVLFNQAAAVRKQAFNALGGFREEMRLLEDYDFALRLSLLGPFAYVKAPLVSYGIGQSNSLSQNCVRDRNVAPRAVVGILESLLNNGGIAPEVRGYLRRQLRWSRWRSRVIQYGSSGNRALATVGRAAEWGLRVRDGLLRRSPWLPRMRVIRAFNQAVAAEQTGTLARPAGAAAEKLSNAFHARTSH
jgi:glycosyltransferase involved in cell wall biosynthesis